MELKHVCFVSKWLGRAWLLCWCFYSMAGKNLVMTSISQKRDNNGSRHYCYIILSLVLKLNVYHLTPLYPFVDLWSIGRWTISICTSGKWTPGRNRLQLHQLSWLLASFGGPTILVSPECHTLLSLFWNQNSLGNKALYRQPLSDM
jgi:hypothetical protein